MISSPSTKTRIQKYQWLLFDADGTLFDFDAAESAAIRQALARIEVEFQPGQLTTYQRINKALWLAVENGKISPALVKVRRFEEFFAEIKIDYSPAAFAEHYLEHLADCSELIPGAGEVIQTLAGKYQMAILTNGLSVVQRRRLARSPIRSHIKEIIISEEIGWAKPAREFFDIALARLGSPPLAETLMIGDGWGPDISGAVQYGIDACWYNPAQKPQPTDLAITREITSLTELAGWLA